MSKVKLPKDVCNALDDLVAENFTNYQITYLTAQREWTDSNYICLNSQDVNAIMRALVVGYEAELTPEERIKDLYNNLKEADNSMTVAQAYRAGMKDALDALDIKYDWLNKGDKTKK